MKCPVCGGETGVDPPRRGAKWTAAQVAFLRRLRSVGLEIVGCAYVLGVSVSTVRHRLYQSRYSRLGGAGSPYHAYDVALWSRTAARDARGRILPKDGIQGEKERL